MTSKGEWPCHPGHGPRRSRGAERLDYGFRWSVVVASTVLRPAILILFSALVLLLEARDVLREVLRWISRLSGVSVVLSEAGEMVAAAVTVGVVAYLLRDLIRSAGGGWRPRLREGLERAGRRQTCIGQFA